MEVEVLDVRHDPMGLTTPHAIFVGLIEERLEVVAVALEAGSEEFEVYTVDFEGDVAVGIPEVLGVRYGHYLLSLLRSAGRSNHRAAPVPKDCGAPRYWHRGIGIGRWIERRLMRTRIRVRYDNNVIDDRNCSQRPLHSVRL